MKCPECDATGQRSKVYVGMSTITCLSWTTYYDEDGVFHNDNPNTVTTEHRCSNGHRWVNRVKSDGS